MVEPPKPRLRAGIGAMSAPSVFQNRMLDEPTNRKPQGAGMWSRSAAAKAAISGANRSGPAAVAAGWADAGAAKIARQAKAMAVARMAGSGVGEVRLAQP